MDLHPYLYLISWEIVVVSKLLLQTNTVTYPDQYTNINFCVCYIVENVGLLDVIGLGFAPYIMYMYITYFQGHVYCLKCVCVTINMV